METVVEDQQSISSMIFSPLTMMLEFLATYGWHVIGGTAAALYLITKLKQKYEEYRQAKEDAEYHKDPDKALVRMEAIQRAREKQQAMLLEASIRAREAQEELAARKREENLERLEKYGSAAGGRRLGASDDDAGYLPLSGGASTSSYRAPKKKCPGGGCGR